VNFFRLVLIFVGFVLFITACVPGQTNLINMPESQSTSAPIIDFIQPDWLDIKLTDVQSKSWSTSWDD
jgi:hypothetical protein